MPPLDILEELKMVLGVSSPGRSSFVITPSDSQELPIITRGLYVGVTGDIKMKLVDDADPTTFVGVPAGSFLPVQVRRVYLTGTSAGSLVGVI